ncbi:MAG: AAA family ATPase [Acidobacteria bacterium]|nr:AAA family ATPase [Acidobacteriota bacterium]
MTWEKKSAADTAKAKYGADVPPSEPVREIDLKRPPVVCPKCLRTAPGRSPDTACPYTVPKKDDPEVMVDCSGRLELVSEYEARRLEPKILERLDFLKSDQEAKDRIRRQLRGAVEIADGTELSDFLSEPDPEEEWLVHGLQQTGHRVIVVAQQKAGKTTLIANLTRCLLDGGAFLGRFPVAPIPFGQRVAIIDLEMPRKQLRRWIRKLTIQRQERCLKVWTLRDEVQTFNLLDPDIYQVWVRLLRNAKIRYLILDCLAPALSAMGLKENNDDVSTFFLVFGRLMKDAGISEWAIAVHAGYGEGGHARGASRLGDHCDVQWFLLKAPKPRRKSSDEAEEEDERRFFRAEGRDVLVPEQALDFAQETNTLTLSGGGSRVQVQRNATLTAVLDYLREQSEPVSQAKILAALKDKGLSKDPVVAAIRLGKKHHDIVVTPGPGKSHLHRLATDAEKAQVLAAVATTSPMPFDDPTETM